MGKSFRKGDGHGDYERNGSRNRSAKRTGGGERRGNDFRNKNYYYTPTATVVSSFVSKLNGELPEEEFCDDDSFYSEAAE